ncbi:3-keto-5-aminohexanoate cleavage protein [Mycobacterium sp.]|uniref:3-keto-5-aminohexanoate cleavage protein n=1 Tax=Mycobacterium sp. TaxID=1785 RepID=UPI002CCD4363|nr:3-keto-5-aminohexanoate cleavage protein [Mycobacterium sp.]HKP41452.1 3-keto-5-aminohexanoate cleavage protein [Mycobacterium sp.]
MPPSPKIYVKACINGARTPDQHPNLPVTPEQLAAEAVAAHRAGAKAVHMHPKTADGVDSLLPEVVDAAVSAVRHAAPGLPLGVTTGFWALPDAEARMQAVDGWSVLPDFASVNWHEPGSEDLARLLLSKGLGVECGIFHAAAAASWAASEVARHCMRVMIELSGDGDIATADDLLSQVLAAGSPAPVLLHGLDESCWPLLQHAGTRGVQTRIGLEDTLRLPDGSTAPDNAALVSAAVQLLSR